MQKAGVAPPALVKCPGSLRDGGGSGNLSSELVLKTGSAGIRS